MNLVTKHSDDPEIGKQLGLSFPFLSPPDPSDIDNHDEVKYEYHQGEGHCGDEALNKQLCPDLESGCQNTEFGHECLCNDLLPVHYRHGCEKDRGLDEEDSVVHPDADGYPGIGADNETFVEDISSNSTDSSSTSKPHDRIIPGANFEIDFSRNGGQDSDPDFLQDRINILFMLGAILLLIIIIGVVVFIISRRKLLKATLRQSQPPSKGSLAKCIEQYVSNPNYHPGDCLNKLINQIEISREKVNYSPKDKIGEGAFGLVYRGIYKMNNELGDEMSREVAIKELKPGLSPESQGDFEQEIEILSSFDHINIVRLLGIFRNEDNQMPSIVFEYMGSGDLADFLRSHAPRSKALGSVDDISNSNSLSKDDLLWISAQVANGMKYLSDQHFVHRDLATRNCLVGDHLTVKISDFGMSRDIYTCDYYKVVKLILQGILLIPPDECPDFIYKMMATTWKTEAKDRTNFEEILQIFTSNYKPFLRRFQRMEEEASLCEDRKNKRKSNPYQPPPKPKSSSGVSSEPSTSSSSSPSSSTSLPASSGSKTRGFSLERIQEMKDLEEESPERESTDVTDEKCEGTTQNDDLATKEASLPEGVIVTVPRDVSNLETPPDPHHHDLEVDLHPIDLAPLQEDDNNYMVPLGLQEIVVQKPLRTISSSSSSISVSVDAGGTAHPLFGAATTSV